MSSARRLRRLWALLTLHKFEMRVGLVWGPFIPVYGVGAVVMTLLLYKSYKRRDLFIFTARRLSAARSNICARCFQELRSARFMGIQRHDRESRRAYESYVYADLGHTRTFVGQRVLSVHLEADRKDSETALHISDIVMCVFITVDMVVSGAAVVRRVSAGKGYQRTVPSSYGLTRILTTRSSISCPEHDLRRIN